MYAHEDMQEILVILSSVRKTLIETNIGKNSYSIIFIQIIDELGELSTHAHNPATSTIFPKGIFFLPNGTSNTRLKIVFE